MLPLVFFVRGARQLPVAPLDHPVVHKDRAAFRVALEHNGQRVPRARERGANRNINFLVRKLSCHHLCLHFPKVIDKPRKILPNFKRGKSRESLYIVPLELLIPISRQEFNDIDFYLDRGGYDYSQAPYGRIWQEFEDRVNELNKKYPSLKQFYQDYKFMQQNAHVEGVEDITQRNIMKRSNGEFVFSDPFWHGETPYAAYDRMMKSEIDDFPEYEPPEPEVMGGKRFKKPKPLKPMKRVPEPADEVPF